MLIYFYGLPCVPFDCYGHRFVPVSYCAYVLLIFILCLLVPGAIVVLSGCRDIILCLIIARVFALCLLTAK